MCFSQVSKAFLFTLVFSFSVKISNSDGNSGNVSEANVTAISCGLQCDPNADCVDNTYCKCNVGFDGNGSICIDIDECLTVECPDGVCLNLPGKYECVCEPGSFGDVSSCGYCVSGTFKNTAGSHACIDCPAGTYSDKLGATICTSCPKNSNTWNTNTWTDGATTCVCEAGYVFDAARGTCDDVDECDSGGAIRNTCDCLADCNNTVGSFTCACAPGYYGAGTLGTCADPCAAQLDRCDNSSRCVFADADAAGYRCACRVGFALGGNASTTACSDPIPPGLAANCGYAFFLSDAALFSPSAYPDRSGFAAQYGRNQSESAVCADVDECARGLHACDVHAACTNTVGSFQCACLPGWNGTGLNHSCTNIDECRARPGPCSPLAACFDTPGSFECVCNCGYAFNGSHCADVDECTMPAANRTLGTNGTLRGAAPPECAATANGTAVRVQALEGDCDAHADCANTVGSFRCTCRRGYRDAAPTLRRANGTNCTDVDECAAGTADCDRNATCANGAGSFSCHCNAGFAGNGTACADIDECANGTACAAEAACFNTVGSFYCLCGPGYWGDNASSCRACAAGAYKNSSGQHNCSLCARGKHSALAASRNESLCEQCPNHTDSPEGSPNQTWCLCLPGYTAERDGLPCWACSAGSYKSAAGLAPCTNCSAGTYALAAASTKASDCLRCPENSTSWQGSTALNACSCNTGYWAMENGVPCSACMRGTFKNVTGPSNCTLCGSGKYSSTLAASSESQCQACTSHSISMAGSGTPLDCLCNAGFTAQLLTCVPCGAGMYKNVTGPDVCQPCTEHSNSAPNSISSMNCSCNAGFAESASQICYPCTVGKFSNGSGRCFDCPGLTISDDASEDITDCVCNAGYTGRDGGPCEICPLSTYKPLIGSADCEPCPSNSQGILNGSVSPDLCRCNQGYLATGIGSAGCVDMNECQHQNLNTCEGAAKCMNTEGSYVCTCPQFSVSNGTSCTPSTARIEILGTVFLKTPVIMLNLSSYRNSLAFVLDVPLSAVDFVFVEYFNASAISIVNLLHQPYPNTYMREYTLLFKALVTVNSSFIMEVDAINLTSVNDKIKSQTFSHGLYSMQIIQYNDRNESRCGDGFVSVGETCDDGTLRRGDGCSEFCEVETGWLCIHSNSSQCEDINECKTQGSCSKLARCINTNGSFLCSCLFRTLDVYGDGTVCEETPGSIANNTAFSNVATVLPGRIAEGFVQDIAIRENIMLISRAGANSTDVYQKQGNAPWPSAPTARLWARDYPQCSSDGLFGTTVAVALNHAVIGSSKGCVLIYKFHKENLALFALDSTILSRSDLFYGISVSTTESSVLVGAYGTGSAFLYVRNVDQSWPAVPDVIFRAGRQSFFGYMLCMTEDQIFISQKGGGLVNVYVKSPYGNWSSSVSFVLDAPFSKGAGAVFGPSLSATDNHVFVGDPSARRVYIFSRFANHSWPRSPTKELHMPEETFGFCVANTDLLAVVSAYENNAAFVYRIADDGQWIGTAVQRIAEAHLAARFLGHSCAMSNFHVALGSHQDANTYIHSASCALNTFGWSIEQCTQCPQHTISPYLSRDVTDCTCQPGFHGPNGGPCSICPVNFYCEGGTHNASCPDSTKSVEGSDRKHDCKYAAFTFRMVQQFSNLPNRTNNITFTIATNVAINPSEDGDINITIDGLSCLGNCTLCMPNELTISCLNPSAKCPFSPIEFKNGILTLKITGVFSSATNYTFALCILNPTEGQYSPNIGIMATFGFNKIYIPRQPMQKGLGNREPLAILGFGASEMEQSTSSQLSNNYITATLKLTSTMPKGSYLTISGLMGSTSTNSTLQVQNQVFPAPIFSQGLWNFTSSSLVLTVTDDIQGNVSFSISFLLFNGNTSQEAPIITLSGSVSDQVGYVAIHPVEIDVLQSNSAAMLIAGFKTALMVQNSTVPEAPNQITVTLQSRITLSKSMFIVVGGLINSLTQSQQLQINQDTQILSRLNSIGVWNQQKGELAVEVLEDCCMGQGFALSFIILNPSIGQESPPVYAKIIGSVYALETMQKGQGEAAPFLIAGFRVKKSSQTSPWPGCKNTILITINLFVGLAYSNNSDSKSFVILSELRGILGSSYSINSTGSNQSDWWSQSEWDHMEGTLILKLNKEDNFVEPNLNYDLKMNVTNGYAGQFSPSIEIFAAGPSWSMATYKMKAIKIDQDYGNSATLVIAGIRSVTAHQSNSVANATNTITVSFSLFSDIPGGSQITLSGFLGSSTVDHQKLIIKTLPEQIAEFAVWSMTAGRLIFNTSATVKANIIQGTIKFDLQNPSVAQDAIAVNMTINCPLFCHDVSQIAMNGIGNSGPFLVAGFKKARLFQRNSSISAQNLISLAITSTSNLLTGSLLSLKGLACLRCGCFDCCTLKLFKVLANGVQANESSIKFYETSGEKSSYPLDPMTILLMTTMFANVNYEIIFSLRNPNCLGQGVSKAFISLTVPEYMSGSDKFEIFPAPIDLGKGALAPFLVSYFLRSKVSQSNSASLALNNLSVSFEINCPLAPASQIMISGLKNSNTVSGNIQLYDVNTSLFLESALWDNARGQLWVTIGSHGIMGGASYNINFQLRNPSKAQQSPVLSIEALDPLARTKVEMTKGVDSFAPFLIVEFQKALIGQSSIIAGSNNTISVTFSISMKLEAGSEISISGLSGTNTYDLRIGINWLDSADGVTSPVGAYGSWVHSSGMVVITVVAQNGLPASTDHRFSFVLQNPSAAQKGVLVSISASGTASVAWTQMTAGLGKESPLLVTTNFSVKNVWQSTPSAAENNTLRVTLSTSSGILLDQHAIQFTLAGLSGSATPDGILPVRIRVVGSFLSSEVQLGNRILGKTDRDSWIPGTIKGLISNGYRLKWDGSYACLNTQNNLSGPVNYSYFCDLCIDGCSSCSTCTWAETSSEDIRYCSQVKQLNFSNQPMCETTILLENHGYFGSDGTFTFSFASLGNQGVITTLVFEFQLKNSLQAQSSPDVSLSSTDLNIIWMKLDKAADIHAPLLTAGFVSASITQSDPSQGAQNLITLTLVTQTSLLIGCQILVSGFNGTIIYPFPFHSKVVNNTFNGTLSETFAGMNDTTISPSNSGNITFNKTFKFTESVSDFNVTIIFPNNTSDGTLSEKISSSPRLFSLRQGNDTFIGMFSETEKMIYFNVINNVSASSQIRISFYVRNPGNGQQPPILSIESRGIIRMSQVLLNTSKDNNAALLVAEFMTKYINQSTVYSTALNTYSVLLMTNVLVSPGSKIMISGLKGQSSRQPATVPALFSTNYSAGNLTMTALVPLLANRVYDISFTLYNLAALVEESSIRIEILEGPIIFASEMAYGLGNSIPCLVAGFYNKSIWQDSPGQGNSNTIYVQFSTNVDILIANNWSLKVSNFNNLYQALPSIAESVIISFADQNYSASGEFDPSTSAIAFYLNQENIFAKTNIRFSFNITNPRQPQNSSDIYIQLLSFRNHVTQLTIMDSGIGNNAPLFVIGFSLKTIQQNSVSAATLNTLTVDFALSGTVTSNSFVTITGLTGFNTESEQLDIFPSSNGTSFAFMKKAAWNRTFGWLTIQITGTIERQVVYSFRFSVLNPSQPVSQAIQYIEMDHPKIFPVAIDAAPGNSAPLLIAGFKDKNIGQSNPTASVPNTITITLSSFASLSGSNISISGLIGSDTPDDDHIEINCSYSTVFEKTARWSQRNGTLVLNLVSVMQADTHYTLSFVLMNPATGQSSPQVSIEAVGHISISKGVMTSSGGNASPLLVAGFVRAEISQSTPIPAVNNTIIAKIKLNVILRSTVSSIIIAGLNGSQQKSSDRLPITVRRDSAISSSFGSYAKWIHETGSLILDVQSMVYPQFEYEISFVLLNSQKSQDSPLVSVSSNGVIAISPTIMTTILGNTMPLLIAGFIIKSIGQSTPATGFVNTITVTLNNRAVIPKGSYLILSGLNGAQKSAQDLFISDKNESSCFLDRGEWNQATYTVMISIIKDTKAYSTYELSFALLNPLLGQDAPSVSLKISGTLSTEWEIVDSASGNMAPLLISGFAFAEIAQSNPSAGAFNTITIKLRTRASLQIPTQILISGIGVTVTEPFENDSVRLYGNMSNFVMDYAIWDASSRILSLNVTKGTNAMSIYVFSFIIRNPELGQSSQPVFIETLGSVRIPRFRMAGAQGNSAPLLIAGFKVKNIGQSNPTASVPNTITITLSSFASLSGSNISISGLIGSDTPDDDHIEINCSYSTVFEKTARWSQRNGTLVLNLVSVMQADTHYTLSFVLMNPATGQSSPQVSIEAVGHISISKGVMTSSGGNASPLLVAGFVRAEISQSTPSAESNNTITAFFSVNVFISATLKAVFTIAGLSGSLTESTPSLMLMPNSSSIFGSEGIWYQQGNLELRVLETMSPWERYRVSFVLMNPARTYGDLNITISSSGMKMNSFLMDKDTRPNRSPLSVAYFVTKYVKQSTTSAGADNWLSVSIMTYNLLPAGTIIFLSGLTGSLTESSPALDVYGIQPNATISIFNNTGAWTQETGTLALPILQNTEPNLLYIFQFILKNPMNGQDAPDISIGTTGGVSITKDVANSAPGNEAPFLVSDIIVRKIGQSICGAGQANVVTATIGARVALLVPTTLNLFGLTGLNSSQATGPVVINGNFSTHVDGQGYWNSNLEVLSMDITVQTNPAFVYVFSFAIKNPEVGQSSQPVFIETLGSVRIPRIEMERAPGNSAPLLIAGFKVKNIGQSNPTASVPNTITITISSFASLSGSNISISGLIGSDTPDNNNLEVNGSQAVFAKTGRWTQRSGTLIFRINRVLDADLLSFISFSLQNAAAPKAPSSVYIQSDGSTAVSRTLLHNDAGLLAPLLVATELQEFFVVQTTANAGAQNTIKVTLTAAGTLYLGSHITLTGLSNTSSPDTTSVNLTSFCNATRSKWTASWVQLIGSIIFSIEENITSGSRCILSFDLINPLAGQDAPILTVSGSGVWIAPRLVVPDDSKFAPLLIADLLIANVEQSSPFFFQTNNLTVYFSSRTTLENSFLVTLSGMSSSHLLLDAKLCTNQTRHCKICNGANLGLNNVQTDPEDHSPNCEITRWALMEGISVFKVTGGIEARAVHNFVLSFKNPGTRRNASQMYIEIRGDVSIGKTYLSPGKCNTAPFLLGGWIQERLSIRQSTVAASAINTIRAVFALHVCLLARDSVNISITGLSGSNTPSGILPIFGALNFGHSAIWTRDLSGGTLVLRVLTDTTAGLNYEVNTDMLNPSYGRDGAHNITIEANGASGILIPRTMMNLGTKNQQPFLIAGFLKTPYIMLHSRDSILNSSMTLNFVSRTSLNGYFGTKITVSGLVNSITPGENIKLNLAPSGLQFGSYCRWFQKSGKLVFTAMRENVEANFLTSLTFVLQNEYNLVNLVQNGQVFIDATYITLNEKGPLISKTPIFTPGFVTAHIGATDYFNKTALASKMLTITLAFNLDILVPVTVSVCGLAGLSSFNDKVNISGGVFESLAFWEQRSGLLILTSVMNLSAFTNYTLSFVVQNDLNGQWPLNVSVSSLCLQCNIMFSDSQELVQGSNPVFFAALTVPINLNIMGNSRALLGYPHHYDALESHPLGTAGWDEVFGKQSCSSPGRKNTISIYFRASATLRQNDVVIISGLHGPIDASGTKQIRTRESGVMLEMCSLQGTGTWDSFEKLLKIYVDVEIVEHSPCTFEFEVTNPHHGQYPPEISIESSGSTLLSKSKLRSYSFDSSPLLVVDLL